MIKVCHVTSLHKWNDTRIFHKECKSLAKKYQVFLIAPNTESKVVDGVSVRGVDLPSINSRMKRFISLRNVYSAACIIDADVYHFHDPELIPVGLKLKKRGKKIIFDCHEDVPQNILSKKWIPFCLRRVASNLYTRYEKFSLSKYDTIVSVTPHIVERLKKINTRTYQLTNYPIYQIREDKREFGKKICFTGVIGNIWLLENVIDAIQGLDVRFQIAGFYATDHYFNKLQEREGWINVDYLGAVDHSRVLSIMQKCSAGMALHIYNNPNICNQYGSLGNQKIFEYMCAGIPVITTSIYLWKEIIEEYDCGVCVEPNDIEGLRNAINNYIQNPLEAKRQGDNGIRAIREKYNWGNQEKILFEMYDYVTSK